MSDVTIDSILNLDTLAATQKLRDLGNVVPKVKLDADIPKLKNDIESAIASISKKLEISVTNKSTFVPDINRIQIIANSKQQEIVNIGHRSIGIAQNQQNILQSNSAKLNQLSVQLDNLIKETIKNRPPKQGGIGSFLGTIAAAPILLAAKTIGNAFTGFGEQIGRSLADETVTGGVKRGVNKTKKAIKIIDKYIIGTEQVLETFASEILRSGSINKASYAAYGRTAIAKTFTRLQSLQTLATNPKELNNILGRDLEIAKIYNDIVASIKSQSGGKFGQTHKAEAFKQLLEKAQPTELADKIINPLIKELQPLLVFIQGMQSYRTNIKAQEFYTQLKASFPILKENENILNVIGGAQFNQGEGGRRIAQGIEVLTNNTRVIPVTNPETDNVLSKTDDLIKELLTKFVPAVAENKDLLNTVVNVGRQVTYALNPMAHSTAAAQAIANIRLAEEQGRKGSVISYSLGGAEAIRTAQAARYAGMNPNVLAMAYPFLNFTQNTPKNFTSTLLEGDPLRFPFQLNIGFRTEQQKILKTKAMGIEAHAYKHLFDSIEFVELFFKTIDEAIPDISPTHLSKIIHGASNLYQLLGAAEQIQSLTKTGEFNFQSPFKGLSFTGNSDYTRAEELFTKVMEAHSFLKDIPHEPTKKYLTNYFEKVQLEMANFFKSAGMNLPEDLNKNLQGYLKYNYEIKKINDTLKVFASNAIWKGADVYFAGELDPQEVKRRLIVLERETIEWFKKNGDRFGDYKAQIIGAYETLRDVVVEFVHTSGKLSEKTLKSIKMFPVEPIPPQVQRIFDKGFHTLTLPSEEASRAFQVDVPQSFKETPSGILAYNKLLQSLSPDVLPAISELSKVAYGLSGATTLLNDKLAYKTSVIEKANQKVASPEEILAYEKLQGRLSPLLYKAIPGEAMITETLKGIPLKDILNTMARPIIRLQKELESETDLANRDRLIEKIKEGKDRFNKMAEKLYYQVGQLGAAMHQMGVVHNDLASSNVFFRREGITSIDLGNARVNPTERQKFEDKLTTVQRAIIDPSFWGILDPMRIGKAVFKGYEKPLPIPETRQPDMSLLSPSKKGELIPIGSYTPSLLESILGERPRLPKKITQVLEEEINPKSINQLSTVESSKAIAAVVDKGTSAITHRVENFVINLFNNALALVPGHAGTIDVTRQIGSLKDITPEILGILAQKGALQTAITTTQAVRGGYGALKGAENAVLGLDPLGVAHAVKNVLTPLAITAAATQVPGAGALVSDATGIVHAALAPFGNALGAETIQVISGAIADVVGNLPIVGGPLEAGLTNLITQVITEAIAGATGLAASGVVGKAIQEGTGAIANVIAPDSEKQAKLLEGKAENVSKSVLKSLKQINEAISVTKLPGSTAIFPKLLPKIETPKQLTGTLEQLNVKGLRDVFKQLTGTSGTGINRPSLMGAVTEIFEKDANAVKQAIAKISEQGLKKGSDITVLGRPKFDEAKFVKGLEQVQAASRKFIQIFDAATLDIQANGIEELKTIKHFVDFQIEAINRAKSQFNISPKTAQSIGGYESQLKEQQSQLNERLNSLKNVVNIEQHGKQIGENISKGLTQGVDFDEAKNKIEKESKDIIDVVQDIFEISSPSRLFRRFGTWLVEGFVQGINYSAPKASASVKRMIEGTKQSASNSLLVDIDNLDRELRSRIAQKRIENFATASREKGLGFVDQLSSGLEAVESIPSKTQARWKSVKQSLLNARDSYDDWAVNFTGNIIRIQDNFIEAVNSLPSKTRARWQSVKQSLLNVRNSYDDWAVNFTGNIIKEQDNISRDMKIVSINKQLKSANTQTIPYESSLFKSLGEIKGSISKTFDQIKTNLLNTRNKYDDWAVNFAGNIVREEDAVFRDIKTFNINRQLKSLGVQSVDYKSNLFKSLLNARNSYDDWIVNFTGNIIRKQDDFIENIKSIPSGIRSKWGTVKQSLLNIRDKYDDWAVDFVGNIIRKQDAFIESIRGKKSNLEQPAEIGSKNKKRLFSGWNAINELEKKTISKDLWELKDKVSKGIPQLHETLTGNITSGEDARVRISANLEEQSEIQKRLLTLIRLGNQEIGERKRQILEEIHLEQEKILKIESENQKLKNRVVLGDKAVEQMRRLNNLSNKIDKAIINDDPKQLRKSLNEISRLINITQINAGTKAFHEFIHEITDRLPEGIKKSLPLIKGLGAAIAGFVAFQFLDPFQMFFTLQERLRSILEATRRFEELSQAINFSVGSAQKGAEALSYVTEQSDRLKISLQSSLEGFSKLAAAGQGNNKLQSILKDTSEAILQASRALNLSPEAQSRAIVALSQIAAKGVVSQEELRQQLAEAIPNTFQVASRAFGVTEQQLNKLIESGLTAQEFLAKFGTQLKRETFYGAIQGTKTLSASMNDFSNQSFLLQKNLGQQFEGTTKATFDALAFGFRVASDHAGALKKALELLVTTIGITLFNVARVALPAIGNFLTQLALKLGILQVGIKGVEFAFTKLKATAISAFKTFAIAVLIDAVVNLWGAFTQASEKAKEFKEQVNKLDQAINAASTNKYTKNFVDQVEQRKKAFIDEQNFYVKFLNNIHIGTSIGDALYNQEIVRQSEMIDTTNKSLTDAQQLLFDLKNGHEHAGKEISKTADKLGFLKSALEDTNFLTNDGIAISQEQIDTLDKLIPLLQAEADKRLGLSNAYGEESKARTKAIEDAKALESKRLQGAGQFAGKIPGLEVETIKLKAAKDRIASEIKANRDFLEFLKTQGDKTVQDQIKIKNELYKLYKEQADNREKIEKNIIDKIDKFAEDSIKKATNAEQLRTIKILELQAKGVITAQKADDEKFASTQKRIKEELDAENNKIFKIQKSELNKADKEEQLAKSRSDRNAKVIEYLQSQIDAQERFKQRLERENEVRKQIVETQKEQLDIQKSYGDLIVESLNQVKELEQARSDFINAVSNAKTQTGDIRIEQLRRALEIRKELKDNADLSPEQRQALQNELAILGVYGDEQSIVQQIAKIQQDNQKIKLQQLEQEYKLKQDILAIELKTNEIQAEQRIIDAQSKLLDARQKLEDARIKLQTAKTDKEKEIASQQFESAGREISIAEQQLNLQNQAKKNMQEIGVLRQRQLEIEKQSAIESEKSKQSQETNKTNYDIATERGNALKQQRINAQEWEEKRRAYLDLNPNSKEYKDKIKEIEQKAADARKELDSKQQNNNAVNIQSTPINFDGNRQFNAPATLEQLKNRYNVPSVVPLPTSIAPTSQQPFSIEKGLNILTDKVGAIADLLQKGAIGKQVNITSNVTAPQDNKALIREATNSVKDAVIAGMRQAKAI